MPEPSKKDALKIIERLKRAGHIAYLVGGCVRDMVRGVEPTDFDIATDAAPDKVRSLFKNAIPIGEDFGVMLVVVNRVPYEVATFRVDEGYSDGRRPDRVRFASPEEDALRRDFTVNGMFYDPLEDKLIDHVGGRADLEKGVIRAIGNPVERFREDKLRLMRAARFAALLDFKIEKKTLSVIKKKAGEIKNVSAERIREELTRILTGPRPRAGMELLSDLGLLEYVLPEAEEMKGVMQPAQFHPEGDVWTHTMLMLDGLPEKPEAELALAVLLHDVGKPATYREAERIRFDRHSSVGAEMAGKIMRGLRYSRKQQTLVEALVAEHIKFMEVRKMRLSTLKKFMRMNRFDLHLELHRLDCEASHGKMGNYEFIVKKLAEFKADEEQEVLRPTPLITGRDLIGLGMTPGPKFKEILDAVEDAQLENRLATREEAIELAKSLQ